MTPTRASSGEQCPASFGDNGAGLGPATLDERALAARWSISIRTLQHWRRHGIGPVYMKLGARVSYRMEDIEQYERQALRRGSGERVFD